MKKMFKILTMVASVAVLSAGLVSAPVQASAAEDVYTTPGKHTVNGRQWSTTCEKYSSTVTRCTTDILATQITEVKGKFESKTGWVFNNLTYKPSERSQWSKNPLGYAGSWTSKDGRQWKTECDNASTGGNGCRSYIKANVIELDAGKYVSKTKWVFNNIVQFTPPVSAGGGTPASTKKTPTVFGKDLAAAAQQNQRNTGIPASVTIGMAALETGWGGSGMARSPINSYFSIKCGGTTPYSSRCVDIPSYEYTAGGTRYMKVSSFRAYDSVKDSILDYGRLLSTSVRYRPAFQYKDNPDEFIRVVRKAGYATDPSYSEIVIGIMKKYDFYQYDV